VAPVAHLAIDVLGFRSIRRDDPIHRALEGVAVVGVALQSLRREHPTALGTHREGDFAAELVAFVGLALGDALHLWGMNAIKLALIVALLTVEPPSESEQPPGIFARRKSLALDVPNDPAQDLRA
jgi:hypothetical protein